MKELDFDELDRAVNSLMTNTVTSAPSSSDTPEETTIELQSSPEITTTHVSFDTLEKGVVQQAVEQSDTEPVVVRTIPGIRRSGGRFMDVVHPSSDMKQQQSPSLSTSRQRLTISPVVPPIGSVTESSASDDDSSVVSIDTDKNTAPANEWPDPIDISGFKQIKADLESDTDADIEQKNTLEEDQIPQTSPFLTDAKVEKRPLGGNSSFTHSEPGGGLTSDATDTDDPINSADDQIIPAPIDFEAPLPAEFQEELVAIESGSNQAEQGEDIPVPIPVVPVVVVPEVEKIPVTVAVEVKKPATLLIPDHFPDEDIPVLAKGPSSIAQQYREEPNSGDQSNGSIYDTDAYHKPLSHPTQKKSGWLWIVWIILILAVGAGIGASLYYFGIVK